jgi:spermidine/putrescine transport system permease protein
MSPHSVLREAIFLLIILPFWSNALVRTFSWTMVLRAPLNLLFTYPAIVIGLVHAYLPYAILTCYISLQAIDDALIEAARSLGATQAQAFRRVTLPLSLPGVLAAVFLIFVPVIGSFMEPRILGGKDAIMLGPIIEGQFNTAFNWPLGAALSFTMLAIVLVILLVASPFLKRQLARA